MRIWHLIDVEFEEDQTIFFRHFPRLCNNLVRLLGISNVLSTACRFHHAAREHVHECLVGIANFAVPLQHVTATVVIANLGVERLFKPMAAVIDGCFGYWMVDREIGVSNLVERLHSLWRYMPATVAQHGDDGHFVPGAFPHRSFNMNHGDAWRSVLVGSQFVDEFVEARITVTGESNRQVLIANASIIEVLAGGECESREETTPAARATNLQPRMAIGFVDMTASRLQVIRFNQGEFDVAQADHSRFGVVRTKLLVEDLIEVLGWDLQLLDFAVVLLHAAN